MGYPAIAGDGSPSPALSLNFLSGAMDPRITFTRASTATYTDIIGTIQTAAINVALFDFDPVTHKPLGLLLEAPATNYLLNSGAPATQTTASLSTGTYTLWMDGTGSATTSAGTATITGAGTASSGVVNTFVVTVAGTVTVTVSGSPTRFQLENSGGRSSYIPTVGSTVTRAQDYASISLGSWYASPGTINVEFSPSQPGSSYQGIAELITSGADRWVYRFDPTFAAPRLYEINTASQPSIGGATIGPTMASGVTYKTAFTIGLTSSAYSNGTQYLNGTASYVGSPTSLNFGREGGAGGLFGYIRAIRFFGVALPNGAIAALTT